jgi:class 3 adenylate cyclase
MRWVFEPLSFASCYVSSCSRQSLPPAVALHQDNEVRAVAAAQDMIKALRGLNLEAGIGITAGTVYCGFVGAEKRCEYAMMGASVNLSARLMAAAPSNSIRVDGEVSFK